MNKIISYLLKNYDPDDTEIFLKAKFILFTTFFVLLTVTAGIIYTAFLSGWTNPVVLKEFFCAVIMLAAFAILVKGKYNTAIHIILVTGFATVWAVLFSQSYISLLTNMDTIVFIIGLLAAMPLMFFKSRTPMILYFIVNMVLFCFYIVYLHTTADLTKTELLDYFFDNFIVMTFVFLISFNLFAIYQQVLGSLKKELEEKKHSEDINKTLFAFSNAVNITLNLEALYKQTHTLLSEIIDVTNFFIALVNERNHTISFPYHVDTVEIDFSPVAAFNPKESLTGLVVSKKGCFIKTRPVEGNGG